MRVSNKTLENFLFRTMPIGQAVNVELLCRLVAFAMDVSYKRAYASLVAMRDWEWVELIHPDTAMLTADGVAFVNELPPDHSHEAA